MKHFPTVHTVQDYVYPAHTNREALGDHCEETGSSRQQNLMNFKANWVEVSCLYFFTNCQHSASYFSMINKIVEAVLYTMRAS